VSASESRIYHRLQLAAHRLQKTADRALLAAAGLTTPQAAVLAIIGGNAAATQSGVARQLGINESAMTAMIARLQDLGFVEKVRRKGDARAWTLRLTEQGRAAALKARKPLAQLNAEIDSALKPDEVAQLADYLERLAAAFESGDHAEK